MGRLLADLIATAVLGGEEAEETSAPTVEPKKEEPAASASETVDVEKIASALEFIGRRGISTFLTKTAEGAACPPPGTNAEQSHASHTQKQVGPHKGASPMNPGAKSGPVETNAKDKPGLPAPKDGVDTVGEGKGDHHPGLASNEAAIDVDKKDKAKKVSPALAQVLDTPAFADPKLKENLSGAAGKGDKNIHKSASYNLADVQAELQRRAGRA
jgi:hypothetical protein